MDEGTREMAEALALVAGIALAWGKAFGPYQVKLSDIVNQWFAVPSERKGGVNLAVGIVLAALFTTALAWYTGHWRILPFSLMAGLVAAVDASQIHDANKAQVVEARVNDTADEAYEQGRQDTIAAVRARRHQIREDDPRRAA